MASCIRYQCSNCEFSVNAWSDGNPYYIDDDGQKHYAYHPDHEALAKCIGNDVPHLCLACGEDFNVDSRTPVLRCTACHSDDVAPLSDLEGKGCPKCKAGTFVVDPRFYAIL